MDAHEKDVVLCPGQGAQVVGMGRDLFESFAEGRRVFEDANDVLGFDLAAKCFDGPEAELNRTDVSQPAIFTTGVACFHAAVKAGVIDPDEVATYAGLSLGEYTALHLAGVFTFDDGLRLVRRRGELMQQAASATASGMVTLLGADEAAVEKLCAEQAQGEVLVAANYNCPGQIVASGSMAACERLTAAATEAGFRAIPLKVAGAFHSPLMQPAADAMAAELDKVEFREPGRPVWSNVTARPHAGADEIRRLLVEQIVKPVRWQQTTQRLVEFSPRRFVELAPGRVLAGLLKKVDRKQPVESLQSAESLIVAG